MSPDCVSWYEGKEPDLCREAWKLTVGAGRGSQVVSVIRLSGVPELPADLR